ncbi:MAG TPA: SBBP repeat-containing protein, partial [Pseudogulbenkiania sp.]|nr:SBBP repeat-containing protein [Pseudogulbenkiania sp.]
EETLPGKSHYFVGADKSAWHTDISNYSRVRYHSVYPGIDLVYHGNQRQLEYDFEVSPGANPRAIALGFHGASSFKVDADGNLVIQTGRSTVIQHKPVIYQDIAGTRKAVAGTYRIQGKNQVGFQLASYDHSKPLVIDPTLSYSTFLGGTTGSGNVDSGSGIAVDSSGNVYVTGNTSTNDFPTVNPLQTSNQVPDVFVAKLNATGTALVYSTYLRGSVSNSGTSIAVDAAGNAYVTGYTLGKDFPITANVVQPTLKGIVNAFVTKLSPTGNTLVYSTYLGGSNADYGMGIAVDSNNSAYVTGYTMSADFPTANAVQTTLAGQRNAFVAKLDPLGGSLVYSTYLGGGGVDFGSSIAVDSAGGAYITGQTSSTDFPTVNAFQPSLRGNANAFVVNLHPTGKPILYSTYLGGSGRDGGRAIAVDSTGHSYITGETSSTDFLAQNKLSGGKDAFVAKLSMDSLGL